MRYGDVVYGADAQVGTPEQTTGAAAGSLVGAVLDIFGRVVKPGSQAGAPGMAPVATSGTPLWVWILIPVAGVVAIGVISRKLRRKKK